MDNFWNVEISVDGFESLADHVRLVGLHPVNLPAVLREEEEDEKEEERIEKGKEGTEKDRRKRGKRKEKKGQKKMGERELGGEIGEKERRYEWKMRGRDGTR